MAAPVQFDPFTLALGQVALVTPWFESALQNLYTELVADEALSVPVLGANYDIVRERILKELADRPAHAQYRAELQELLQRCDDAWNRRNIVMHSLWIVNDVGTYWGTKVGRRNRDDEVVHAQPEDLLVLAQTLDSLQFLLIGLTRRVIDVRRAASGQPPLGGSGLAWPLGRGKRIEGRPLLE